MDYPTKQRLKKLERKLEALREESTSAQSKLGGRVDQVTEEVERINNRIERLGDNAGPVQIKAFTAEVERLETKINNLWSDLESELSELRNRVDDHDLKFANHGERIESVEVRAGANANAIARLEQTQTLSRVHPITWVLGIIAGIIAGWVWGVHDWVQTVTSTDGTKTVVENAAANSIWAAIVCGLCVGLLVLFIFSLVLRDEAENQEVVTAEADAEAESTIVIDRNVPTRVQPVVRDAPAPAADRNAGVY